MGVPRFHLFCPKQPQYDEELAKIKAIKITNINPDSLSPYTYDVLYKDGTTTKGNTANVKTMHDKFNHFLPVSVMRDLHNKLLAASRPLTYADCMTKGACEKRFDYNEWYYRNNGSYPDTYQNCRCR